MEYPSIYDWIEKHSIRIVRQGQRNFYVEADVAASIGAAPIRPGQYHLGVAEFERISIENTPTICLTAGGLQKLYARTSGKLDIEGGMSSLALNSPSLANTKSDWVAPPEPELAYESPIQKALMPYLPSLINPNHAIMVTPELARTLLGVNVANRPKNNRNFKKLCAQLRAGKWKVNGATITLSRNWKLLDGQHRLYAIDEADVPETIIDTETSPVESPSPDQHRVDLNTKQTQIDETISLLETQLGEWLDIAKVDDGDDFRLTISSRLCALGNDFLSDL